MSESHSRRGFTIIEVVIVLAIAGLIFMIVFISVPAVQRIQRDSHRKQDLAILKASIDTWKSNNANNNLDSAAELALLSADYFQHQDPSTGANYQLNFHDVGVAHNLALPPVGQINYTLGHICENDPATPDTLMQDPSAPAHSARKFAVIISLEANPQGLCLDNR
jgi:prepilin-type N-terminal cleavage/methylation domain-containing protein